MPIIKGSPEARRTRQNGSPMGCGDKPTYLGLVIILTVSTIGEKAGTINKFMFTTDAH